ncbi:MAG: transposase, partial [Selenomonadaceae bacterium]|nr:transposase [Selenomonadaceae bacterium]
MQLQLLIAQISFIEGQIYQLNNKINSPITTIPGIFATLAKLVAKIFQSDTSLNSTGKMTKRGSHYLLNALFRVAFVSYNIDPIFKALYQKRHSEGKHHLTCIGAVARKLCYTVYALL